MRYTREEMIESVPRTGFFGHPKGLGILFFVEFWERFSYYGMRAILLFYMYYSVTEGGLGLPMAMAQSIMSLYGALIFMTALLGGWLADRVLGSRRSLFIGATIIMLGHIVLSLPGGVPLFLLSMALIIIGSGLMKPNIANVVGGLYDKNDARMDSGFVIFYMSVNMGALASPMIVGQLQTTLGFHYGFAAAAIGMALALVVYAVYNRKSLGLVGKDIPNPLTEEEKGKYKKGAVVSVVALLAILAITYSTGILTFDTFSYFITGLGLILPIVYFLSMYRSTKTDATEKKRLLAYIPLFLSGVMFWSIQEQGSSILGTFADTKTQLDLSKVIGIDYTVPAAFFQSINPIFIVIFAPVISSLWGKLGKHNPSTAFKFTLGLFFAGISFLIMVIPTWGMVEGDKINPFWLILSFFLCVIGELCLSPVGQSATVKLAPKAFESTMLSLWLLSNATAQGLNAQLVRLYNVLDESQYFGFLGLMAIVLGIIILIISPWTKKMMGGIY
ncbi:peptide MFS transporter [Vagococcus intermedius]|uniref:Di-/tripeptide transporter n=1 Tax=Vagococcus intermedius TaxID=2991418 RepID=A0AAF0CVM2_9ENTE|nr:peptide MFS transporter [Vagococcus intermedius]WEG73662.1 peptide MFS transporter [Vagococcus intermedius]WEG75746.1 peptide MFS transporter [Vagococcus intermedius]